MIQKLSLGTEYSKNDKRKMQAFFVYIDFPYIIPAIFTVFDSPCL